MSNEMARLCEGLGLAGPFTKALVDRVAALESENKMIYEELKKGHKHG